MDNQKPKCTICKEEVYNYADRFYCKYCKKLHCTLHRIPENHKCTALPPKDFFTKLGINVS